MIIQKEKNNKVGLLEKHLKELENTGSYNIQDFEMFKDLKEKSYPKHPQK